MDSAATAADTFVEDTYVKPQFGLIEFLRRIREDQLSVFNPELFSRNMTYARLLFLDHFLLLHDAEHGASAFQQMFGH